MEKEEYLNELKAALAGLKSDLAKCQNTVGMIETFIYLIGKEPISKKG